jgi:hypothetical protein
MSRPTVASVLLCLLGCLAGFLTGRWSVSSDLPESGSSVSGGKRKTQALISTPADAAIAPGTMGTSEKGTTQERLSALLANLDASKRRAALRALGAELGATQPVTGWQMLTMITGLADRQDFAQELCAAWARHDFTAALAACSGLAAGELQASSTSAAIGSWAEAAPDAALSWVLSHLSGSVRSMSISAAVSQWAIKDAASAANWALKNMENSAGVSGIREIMSYWAETNPEAGARWAATLPSGEFRETALESVIHRWADQFPQEAAKWVAGQPGEEDLTQIIAASWAQNDPEAAATWAAAIPDPAARSLVLDQIVATWAAASPQQALAWAAREPNSQSRLALEQAALESWAADDPIAAVAWAERSPQAAEITHAVFDTWAASSPSTLERWIDARAPAKRPDSALEAVSIALAEGAPERAMAKALTIRDPTMQVDTVLRIYGQWEDAKPEAANAWLARNPAMAPHLPARPTKAAR